MKKHFRNKNFSAESQAVLDVATRVISNYRAQGYKLSLRQLYYQLVSKNVVVNTEQSYKRVGDILADARMAGLADWDMIEDRNRETVTPTVWANPAEIVETCARAYRIDFWQSQGNYVMVEKQALEGVLEPVCRKWGVPFTSNKGYSSVTMMFEAGQRIELEFRRRVIERLKLKTQMSDRFELVDYLLRHDFLDRYEDNEPPETNDKFERAGLPKITIIYLGDHDPSGIDMTRDVKDRLSMFSDMTPITVKRIALNMGQIKELQPPENPAKMTDSRAKDYVRRFGESSWELDAVTPEALARMVNEAIQEEVDPTAWAKMEARQKRERKELDNIVKGLK